MKRLSILLIFMILISLDVKSQDNTAQDTISYASIYWSPRYYHHGNQISLRDVSKILKEDPEANRLMKSGKTIRALGYTMAVTGGCVLGYSLNSDNRQLKRQNIAISGAILAGALVVDHLSLRKMKSAIDLYNENEKRKTSNDLTLSIGLSEYQNGIGLKITF